MSTTECRDASGFEGAWTVDPDSLDNSYYKDLTNSRLGWRQQQIDMNHVQWVHGDGTSGIMLNSDMALYKAIQPKPQVSECSYVSCGPSIVASSVEAFAESNALFVTEFSSAFQKLMDHGLPHGMLSQILPTPVMQHQRTNPVPPAPMQVPIDFMQVSTRLSGSISILFDDYGANFSCYGFEPCMFIPITLRLFVSVLSETNKETSP